MQTQYFPAKERGIKDGGWLKSNFFFSFSDYTDPVKSAFGTLVAFNDDFVQTGKGFGIHPRGHFYMLDGEEQIAEMEVSISGNNLTVYHTEVLPKAEGKGLAKKLLTTMVDHARKNALKVIPLCPYVNAQFKRHPEEYVDVWNKKV